MKPTIPLIVLIVAASLLASPLLGVPASSAYESAEETTATSGRPGGQLPTLPPPATLTERAIVTVTPTSTPNADSCFPSAGQTAFHDGFDSPTLSPSWSIVKEGFIHWSLTARPGYLRILTEAGDSIPDARILLLRRVTGNIEGIATNLEFDSMTGFPQAGLLIYQDDRNFLRLTGGFTSGQRVFFRWRTNDWVQVHSVPVKANVLGLRIEKQDNTYVGYYRGEDGAVEVGRFESVDFSNPQAGLGAWSSGGSPRVLVDLDDFCLISSQPTATPTPTATATTTAWVYLPLVQVPTPPPPPLYIDVSVEGQVRLAEQGNGLEGVRLYTFYGPWLVVPPTPAPGYGPSAITDANGYYHVDGQVRNHPEYFQVWPYLEGYTFVPNIEHFHYYNFPDPPVELTASFTAHPVSD